MPFNFHIFNRTKDAKPLNDLLSPKASEQKESKELLTTEQLKNQAYSDSPGGIQIPNKIDYFKKVIENKNCDASVRIAFLQKKHLSVLLENIQKLADNDENKLIYLKEVDEIIRNFIKYCDTPEEAIALVENGLILLKHAEYVSLKLCIEMLKTIQPKEQAIKLLENFLVQLIETPQRLNEEFLNLILGFSPDICKNEFIKNKLLALDPLPPCVLQYVIKSITTPGEIDKFIDLIWSKYADYMSLKSCIEQLKTIQPKEKAIKLFRKFLVQLIETPQHLNEEFLNLILGFSPDICKDEFIKNKLLALDPLPPCVLQYVIKSLTTPGEIEKFIDTIHETTELTELVPYIFIEAHYIILLHRCLTKQQFDRVCGFMLKQGIEMTEGLNEALLACLQKDEFATIQVAEKIVKLPEVSDAVLRFLTTSVTKEKSVAAVFAPGPNQVKIAALHLTAKTDVKNEEKKPLIDKVTVAAVSVPGLPPEAVQTLPVHFSLLEEDKDKARFLSDSLRQENSSAEQRFKMIQAISSEKQVRDILIFIHNNAEEKADKYCAALLKHLDQPWFSEKLIQNLLETKNLSNELLIAIAQKSLEFTEQKTMDLLVMYPALDIFQTIKLNPRGDLISQVLRNHVLRSKTLLKCIERVEKSEHFESLWDARFLFNQEDQHLQALVQKTCGSKKPAEEKGEEEKAEGNPASFALTDTQKNKLLAHQHMILGLARMVLAPDSNNVNLNTWVKNPETLERLALIKHLEGQDIEDILNHPNMTVKIAKEQFFSKRNYRGHGVHFKIASNWDIFCHTMEEVHKDIRHPKFVENWITATRAACDQSINTINRKIAKKQKIELDQKLLTTILDGSKAKYCEHFLKDLEQKNKHPKKAAKNPNSPSKVAADRAFAYYWNCKKALDEHFVPRVGNEKDRNWDGLYQKCNGYYMAATPKLKQHRGRKEDFRYILGVFLKIISFWGFAKSIDESEWFHPITDSMAVTGFFRNTLPKPKPQAVPKVRVKLEETLQAEGKEEAHSHIAYQT